VPTEKERYRFDLDGYLVVRGALARAQVDELNSAIDRHDLDSVPRAEYFLELDAAFRELLVNPRIVPYLGEWLGEGFRLDHYYALFAEAGEGRLQLHGGSTPYDPGQYYHVRNGRIYSGQTVVSYALTPVPAGSGFACIPGSHKSEFSCPSDVVDLADRSFLTTVEVDPGDAVIFTEALTHGTLPWAAEHKRRTLLYKYSPFHMTWLHPCWPDELLAACTPEQRELLEPPYYVQDVQVDGQWRRVTRRRD
jgi:hypothetical protein